jgi:protein-tyrosine-phosphatase
MHGKKLILLVCDGNTCRSPMAKVILEHKLSAAGTIDQFTIESAACGSPTYPVASHGARKAIEALYGEDLLAAHKSRGFTPALINKADLILVMSSGMKAGLPSAKTWTLKEYAGGSGDIQDPLGLGLETYLATAGEISAALDGVVARILAAGR